MARCLCLGKRCQVETFQHVLDFGRVCMVTSPFCQLLWFGLICATVVVIVVHNLWIWGKFGCYFLDIEWLHRGFLISVPLCLVGVGIGNLLTAAAFTRRKEKKTIQFDKENLSKQIEAKSKILNSIPLIIWSDNFPDEKTLSLRKCFILAWFICIVSYSWMVLIRFYRSSWSEMIIANKIGQKKLYKKW